MGSAQGGLHHAGTSVGVRQGNTRHRERAVFVQALRNGHRHYRCFIDRCHRDGGGAGAAVHARSINGLEGEGGIAGKVRRRRKRHVGGLSHRERVTRRQSGATVVLENPAGGNGDDLVAGNVAHAVHIRGRQRKSLGRVLVHRQARIDGDWRVVDRGDVDRHEVSRRIEIDATVGRATVVLHLEGEVAVAIAVGIGYRRENQLVGCNVGGRDRATCGHCTTVICQGASGWPRCDLDRQQAVGAGRVRDVGKAEFGRGKNVRPVFRDRDGVVAAGGRIVDRIDRDVEAAADGARGRLRIVGVGADNDRYRCRAVEVGRALECQAVQEGDDTGQVALAGQHRARHPVIDQIALARIGQRHHRFKQRPGATAIGHVEVAKAVGRVLADGLRCQPGSNHRVLQQALKARHGVTGQGRLRFNGTAADFQQPVTTQGTAAGGVAGRGNVGAGQRRQLCDQGRTLRAGACVASVEQDVGIG